MQFRWTTQSIEWFLAASEYTGFHENLAQALLGEINIEDTVIDFGCGLGCLDLALAPYISNSTAIDISELAIESLKKRIQQTNCKNIFPRCESATEYSGTASVGIMSFFGKSSEGMNYYLSKCQKKLIRIVNMENKSTLYPEEHRRRKKATSQTIDSELENAHLIYHSFSTSLEFGQPLKDEEDAHNFLRYNAPHISLQEMNSFLYENVLQTHSKEYPFYLPNKKNLGIYVLSAK